MKNTAKKPFFTIFLMIVATLFSKVLGLFRSMLLAWTLGDSLEAVAFAAASKIPGAVFDLLFSAAILGCFIPQYGKAAQKSEKAAQAYAGAFFGAALALASAISLIGVIFAPQIIAVSAPKISAEAAALSARLLRIMFPMMVFTAGAYTLTGLLQSNGNFVLPAAISSVSNIFIIAYLVLCGESFSVYALSAIYLASWALQLLTLALPLLAKKRLPRPRLDFKDENLRASAKSAPQIMASSWLSPASVLIAAFFSSFVSDTAFVTYDYSVGIYTIISGIAVYGIGNYIFPKLSAICAREDKRRFSLAVRHAIISILFIIFPIFSATSVMSEECITLLYLRGSFTEKMAHECGKLLSIMAISMPACAVSEILCRAFYAADKARIPMYATLCAIAASIAANSLSLYFGEGTEGIAASFSISQWVYMLFLALCAKRHFPEIFPAPRRSRLAHILPGAVLCFAIMLFSNEKLPLFSHLTATFAIFLKITIVFTLGIVIYLLYVYVIGILRPGFKSKK